MAETPPQRRSLFAELKRRRVFRVAGVYAVVAWVIIEAASTIFPALRLPAWTVTFVTALALLGFPVAVVIAWAFEMTPDGLRRTPPNEADMRAARGGTAGEAGASGADAASAGAEPTGPRTRMSSRAPAFVGLGILISVVGFGAYATLGGRGAAEPGTAAASAHSPRAGERSIAVLPFDNLSVDADNAFFASGVHEDVLTQLALIEDMAVISRTSVLRYADADSLSIPEIGRELGVAYILEGSVRRAGDRVRVTAQLIDARTDEHLWAKNYDRTLDDIFAVQSELALEIAGSLEAELSADERTRIEARPTENMAAYDLDLRAGELTGEGPRANETAIELYRQAIRLDSTFADAYAGLAAAYMMRVQFYGYPLAWADSGAATARRAIELDPELPGAYSALGTNLSLLGRFDETARAYRRALELNPSYASAMNNLGSLERSRGRPVESIRLLRRARRLDPAGAFPAFNLGAGHWLLGNDSIARVRLRRSIELGFPDAASVAMFAALTDVLAGRARRAAERVDSLLAAEPNGLTALFTAGVTAAWTGDWNGAREHLARLYRAAPDGRFGGRLRSFRTYYALALARTGERARADALLDTAFVRAREAIDAGHQAPSLREEIAAVHAIRGDTARALDWLERAYREGGLFHRLLIRDPSYDAVRGTARFRRILQRLEADTGRIRAEVAALGEH